MAFVAQATHPAGALLRDRQAAAWRGREHGPEHRSCTGSQACWLGADAERHSQLRRLESPAFGCGPSPSSAWVF